jgi:hypothetical protein
MTNRTRDVLSAVLILATVTFIVLTSAHGRDNGQWDAVDADVRRWFQQAIQPDTYASCCGEADAYYADSFEVEDGQYVAIITDERYVQGRPPVPVGTRVKVPNNKLPDPTVQKVPNPTGHGIIFMNSNQMVFCYFPPGGV